MNLTKLESYVNYLISNGWYLDEYDNGCTEEDKFKYILQDIKVNKQNSIDTTDENERIIYINCLDLISYIISIELYSNLVVEFINRTSKRRIEFYDDEEILYIDYKYNVERICKGNGCYRIIYYNYYSKEIIGVCEQQEDQEIQEISSYINHKKLLCFKCSLKDKRLSIYLNIIFLCDNYFEIKE